LKKERGRRFSISHKQQKMEIWTSQWVYEKNIKKDKRQFENFTISGKCNRLKPSFLF
jgi:predicted HAD superfamily Cof-like phosphohydrolase